MDVQKGFPVTGGIGVTSYAKNSSFQKKGSDMAKHITRGTIQEVFLTTSPKSIGIADLGCGSGSNSLAIIKDIVETVEATSRNILHPPQELRVYLNDLPTNDFNSIFKSLPEFYRELRKQKNGGCPYIFIGGYAGSFYGRLFPNKCLHFAYSSYSLHWLSRVPPSLYDEQGKSINKGNIYISASSPPQVSQAYYKQFQEDFKLFLRSRSEELVVGGGMVIILLGRGGEDHVDRGNSFCWELLSRSFSKLVSQGEIEQEKLDSYDLHFYAPSKNEIEDEVRQEGSFGLDRLEMFDVDEDQNDGGKEFARTVRAIQESTISHHFGDRILDSLFDIYARMVDEEMAKEEIKAMTFAIVLRKL